MKNYLYLCNSEFNWIKHEYENISELFTLFTSNNIVIDNDCFVAKSYIGNDSTVLNGSRVDDSTVLNGSTVDGSTVDGSRVLNGEIANANALFAHNLYKYNVSAYINKNKQQVIQLGCHTRTRSEWEANFWNNPNEFPNDNSKTSNDRLRAFKVACFFLDSL